MALLLPVRWIASQILLVTLTAAAPQAGAQLPSGQLSPGQVARALAGRDVPALAQDDKKAGLLASHGRRVARAWSAWEERLGQPLAAWAKLALDPLPEGTLFYPFSGPDFATAHRLWPDAKRYVFVAYQRAGRLPPLAEQESGRFASTLALFREGIDSFAGLGFFITTRMNERFGQADEVEGILGILLLFAELEGFDVLTVEPLRVNADGTDVELHPGDRADRATWNSVRLQLRRRSDGGNVTLDYLRVDLTDRELDERPNEKAWVAAQCRYPTLLKAASFLLHRPSFTWVREQLLAQAPVILQDETGIPYDDLARTFELQLYGRFDGFHERFARAVDEDALRAAYRQPGAAKPLDFKLGYDVRQAACFQYGRRKPVGSR